MFTFLQENENSQVNITIEFSWTSGPFRMFEYRLFQLQKFEGLTGEIQFDAQGGPVKKMYDLVNFRSKDVVKVLFVENRLSTKIWMSHKL